MKLTKLQECNIAWYIECHYGCDRVEIDTEHDKIIIKRCQSLPSYDDAGGLDSIDFDVVEDVIDLTKRLVDEATSWVEQVNEKLYSECISDDDIGSAAPSDYYYDDDFYADREVVRLPF